MALEKQLLQLEERFWKGDADFYRQHLTDDSLMVFAEPVGILTKDQTIQAVAAGPRWAEVEFREARVVRLTDRVAIVIYKARARQEGGDSVYSPLVSSAYVNRQGSWKLAVHQQTPADEG
jgi:hypothetical protein